MKIDSKQKNKLKEFLVKKMKEESEGLVIIEAPYFLNESDTMNFIRVFPQFKDKHIETKINPHLIGGFIIRHGSTVIDASVSSSITNLASRLEH